ncbi:Mediator of RNA polymerase II transcription subunit 7 [Coemansia asiatica]|uniref:Mediator of RNA polymerase II transcription subunit 7 n=1 Tax=Coemansia asiatica TaxID=1052880 RepID=A0A9W7XKD4_9FUNG|nr:Mediator of RNA polymerase II transcription subunit 7 [Coemansia asiatica]KAJ2887581.1 Mediator of RNA polymerase II transcription subunit 7 [Coemansia asiatica]
MADTQQQQQQLDASYPAPPEYFTLFTDDNLAKLANIDNESAMNDHTLKYLVPPPPPTEGTYSNFGRLWQVEDRLPTLAEQKISQLYPDGPIDRIVELKRLNHLVLFEFLDLVDVLIKDPSLYAARTERIREIFVNIHHLINEYRSHQAKETLKLMLRQQIESKRRTTAAILSRCEDLEQRIVTLREEAAEVKARLVASNSTTTMTTSDRSSGSTEIKSQSKTPLLDSSAPETLPVIAKIAESGLENILYSIQDLKL